MFPHQNTHKYTWKSPNGKTQSQIDHILIDRKWHSSILDVRSIRGAGCDTDHYLVVEKVRERLKSLVLLGIRKNFLRSGRSRSLYLSIRRVIKQKVVVIRVYHLC
jgi:hypothetical protein